MIAPLARGSWRLALAGTLLLPPITASAHPHKGPVPPHEHNDFGLEITITDAAVRYDIVVSNGCLNLLVPRERSDLHLRAEDNKFIFLDPGQKSAEEAAFSAYFLAHNPVKADGVALAPRFAGMEFIIALDATGTIDHRKAPPDGHVIIEYPLPAAPKQVELTWDVYSPVAARDMFGAPVRFELAARLDARDESRIVIFTREEPRVTWTAPTTPPQQRLAPTPVVYVKRQVHVPVLAIGLGVCAAVVAGVLLRVGGPRRAFAATAALVVGLAAAGGLHRVGTLVMNWPGAQQVVTPDATAAGETCTALLRNVYRAFDFKTESDIYDVLAQSVDGPLLERVYQEVYQSLIAREQGGAVTRVKGIVMLETSPLARPASEPGAFAVRCRWRVNGVVYHWGHLHERVNEYAARYVLAPRGDRWKLIAASVDEQRRIDTGAPAGSPSPSPAGDAARG